MTTNETLGQTADLLARHRYVTAQEFRESGLLYHVNEAVLWPLGLALFVTYTDGEYVDRIGLMDYGEVVQDPDAVIRAKANGWLAARFREVKP